MSSALLEELTRLPVEDRVRFIAALSPREKVQVNRLLDVELGGPFGMFRKDPVGFVESPHGLDEVAWSLQEEIMHSVLVNKRTAVPACHAPGKSHIAARIIGWWGSVHPPGATRILTTAPTFRQVRNVLWPYIRQVHALHDLPGEMLMVEWYIDSPITKKRELIAEGIKPPDEDDAGLSGLHAPNQLIVVDEAGGISHTFGKGLLGILTGSNTRLLLIGNPPIDDEGSWFEKQCEMTHRYNVIPIPWSKTPNATGEYVGECRSHPGSDPHLVNEHLIDVEYVEDIADEYGTDSAVYLARVDAVFPKTNESRVLPIMWLEAAVPVLPGTRDPQGEEIPLDLCDVHEPGVITMGMDIAGGVSDELTVAEIDNGWASMQYAQVDTRHRDPQYVVGICAKYAKAAVEKHRQRGIQKKVRIKVDSLGLGWNIYGQLKAMTDSSSQLYDPVLGQGAEFVEVDAGANGHDTTHYANVRAEMWWHMRKAIEPDRYGRQAITLNVDKKTLQQLNAPKFSQDAGGRLMIEKKADMLKRGVRSPDRADAILMAWYEPGRIVEVPAVGPLNVVKHASTLPSRALHAGGEGQSEAPDNGFVGFMPL